MLEGDWREIGLDIKECGEKLKNIRTSAGRSWGSWGRDTVPIPKKFLTQVDPPRACPTTIVVVQVVTIFWRDIFSGIKPLSGNETGVDIFDM